jgi:hypothetical protein
VDSVLEGVRVGMSGGWKEAFVKSKTPFGKECSERR